MADETSNPLGTVENANRSENPDQVRSLVDTNCANVPPANAGTANGQGTSAGNGSANPPSLLSGIVGDAQRVSGSLSPCTCGKPPGQGGQHKAGCPRRHDGKKHFAAPVVSAPAPAPAPSAPVASPVEPATPKDYAFYRDLVTKYVSRRVRGTVETEREKWNEVTDALEAGRIASEFDMPKDMIERLGKAVEKCARYYNAPEPPPWLEIAEIYVDWEIFKWLRQRQLEPRYQKLLADKRKATENAKAPKQEIETE